MRIWVRTLIFQIGFGFPQQTRERIWRSAERVFGSAGIPDVSLLFEPHIFSVTRSRRFKLRTVLLVDDHDGGRLTAKWFLGSFGFVVESARTAEEALLVFDPKLHDLVITNDVMPGMNGVEMAHVIKLRSPLTPVLMCSNNASDEMSCVDLVLERPVHLLLLKDEAERLLGLKKTPAKAGLRRRWFEEDSV